MSLSREARIENMGLALKLMYEEVGDDPCEIKFINTADAQYDPVLNTTWEDLVRFGYISDEHHGYVKLTYRGWTTALVDSGETATPEFRSKLGRLSQNLKDAVKGRHQQVLKDSRTLATETDLAWGFVINALRAHLIEEILKREGAEVNDSMHYVVVPIGFRRELL